MTPYSVLRAYEADPIKTLGTSRSIHLIDLAYDKLGVFHAPYMGALVGGIQKRSDGNMELWARKESGGVSAEDTSGTVYVSSSFSSSLITSISGGQKAGVIAQGAFLWFVAVFDQAASFAIQSVAVYQPSPAPSQAAGTQLAFMDFTGSPATRVQEQLVVAGFVLGGVYTGAGAPTLNQMPQSALWS